MANLGLLHSRSDLVDDTAEFVAEDVAFVHLHHRAMKKMKIAATDGAASDFENDIRLLDNLGLGHVD